MDSGRTGRLFPGVLRRLWRASDPGSRCDRVCDALGQETAHQKVKTIAGDYWVCSETGQMQRDQFPTEVASTQMYDEHWRGRLASEGNPDEAQQQHTRRWLKRFEPYRQDGRLLEIGSGLGGLLRAAVAEGWRAQGNEVSPLAARFAQQATGASVLVGPIEQIALEHGVYDVILCNNVFEHLTQPMATLKKMADALRPGGVLYLQTLSGQCLSLWAQPTGWMYYSDTHLYVPTRLSLGHYFEASRLTPIWVRTHGCRTGRVAKSATRHWARRRVDKVMSTLAARTRLGHRIEYILRKK